MPIKGPGELIAKALAEQERQRVRDKLGAGVEDQIARMNAAMDINPIDSQAPPPGWTDRHYDPHRPTGRNGWPLGMVPERFAPGMPVDGNAHRDLIRERHRWRDEPD